MCLFSMAVPYVAGTRIFARAYEDGRQALVYSMEFAASDELAMILPLPLPRASAEDAVQFVNLEGYPDFFDDLERAFPMLMVDAARGGGLAMSGGVPQAPLRVHDVGDFEASFVPTLADFDRLDRRFRFEPGVWEQLPRYRDWGFAVFKLKPERGERSGFWARLLRRPPPPRTRRVHPMAFVFPRRESSALFFPTTHVHDGEVHASAHFDHVLFCQPGPAIAENLGWEPSTKTLGVAMKPDKAGDLVDPSARCFRRVLRGTLPNADQELRPMGYRTAPAGSPGT